MNPPQKIILEGKQILRFSCAETNAPVVYLHTYQEEGTAVLAQCEELNCPPFHLVSISGLRWEEELSPWPHPPVLSNRDHFTGEAEDYAACLTEKILPWAEKQLSQFFQTVKKVPPGRHVRTGGTHTGKFAAGSVRGRQAECMVQRQILSPGEY